MHLDVICNRLWSTAAVASRCHNKKDHICYWWQSDSVRVYVRNHSGSLQSNRVWCSSSRSIWPEIYRTQTTVESKQVVAALLLNRDASKPPVLPLCSHEQALLSLITSSYCLLLTWSSYRNPQASLAPHQNCYHCPDGIFKRQFITRCHQLEGTAVRRGHTKKATATIQFSLASGYSAVPLTFLYFPMMLRNTSFGDAFDAVKINVRSYDTLITAGEDARQTPTLDSIMNG